MGKLEPEIFDREVRRIRETYRGDLKWRDTAELSAGFYLYWREWSSATSAGGGNELGPHGSTPSG